jgi:uncharacterized protein YecE (DUF72 family)
VSGRIVVGTSSWADPGFVKEWYPPGMASRDRLAWYSERFQAVEVNSSFYAVPERPTTRRWAKVTPDGFTFDVKVHQLLSRHSAKVESLPPDLREGVETTGSNRVRLTADIERALAKELVHAVEPLAEEGKMGAFLLQLTPGFSPRKHELEELEDLLEALAPHPVAMELRNRGWVRDEKLDETARWYSERNVAFVAVDAPPGDHFSIMPPVDAVTRDDLAYLRLHGRNTEGYVSGKSVPERFGWVYEDEELEEVAGRVRGMAEQAGEVHVMFNNNRDDDAPSAARRFRALLGQDPGPAPEEPQLRLG